MRTTKNNVILSRGVVVTDHWPFVYLVTLLVICLGSNNIAQHAFGTDRHRGIPEQKSYYQQEPKLKENNPPTYTDHFANSERKFYASSSLEGCRGKEHFEHIVRHALSDLNETMVEQVCRHLPRWEAVTRLWGEDPLIFGLESCAQYRDNINKLRIPPLVRVTGLFNTGTNAMQATLHFNLQTPLPNETRRQQYGGYRVPWGKHTPVRARKPDSRCRVPTCPLPNATDDRGVTLQEKDVRMEHILPVVMIRDPLFWIQSTCRNSYNFKKDLAGTPCPRLLNDTTGQPYRVNLTWNQDKRFMPADSLASMWSQWYQGYFDPPQNFPRLIVRFEDALYHGERVWATVAKCIHGDHVDPSRPYQYIPGYSKDLRHGNLFSAMAKYASEERRFRGMTTTDLEFAKRQIDPVLLKTFQYHIPNST